MSDQPLPETQHQRWLKYGLNVAVASIIVVALAVCLIYLAQRYDKRIDTTAAGVYSLKPQSKAVLSQLKSPVRIVSLYSRVESTDPANEDETVRTDLEEIVGPVEDLLAEYENASDKIQVDYIDPVRQPQKVDDLIADVKKKYAGETARYEAFIKDFVPRYDAFKKALSDESTRLDKLPFDQITTRDVYITVVLAVSTVRDMPSRLDRAKERIDRLSKQRPPDYKGVTDYVAQTMSEMSALMEGVVAGIEKSRQSAEVPAEINAYLTEALPRYQELKKQADGFVKETGELGELKLDALRDAVQGGRRDSILVLGEKELKVLPKDQIWQQPPNSPFGRTGSQAKPVFAGEQRITSAILALTSEQKPKVVFLRGGGPPMVSRSPMGRSPLTFRTMANRLTEMGFDVVEKDYSGQWAMQSQMQGMPAAPEPSDEEIKDAVWVIANLPQPRGMMGMPPQSIAPKLAEHLNNGGSALVMSYVQSDDLSAALDPWGVKIRTDLIVCKPVPKTSSTDREGDRADQVQRTPFVHLVREFGDHLLARPVNSLQAGFAPVVPVEISTKDGFQASALIPFSAQAWGESDPESLGDAEPKFDEKAGDLKGPLFGGAAVQRQAGGRLVVIGAAQFAAESMVDVPDPDQANDRYAPWFPANAELFMNSVFWLARMDPMIAISPSAMQVSRIAPMTPRQLSLWNTGVLLIALPGLVVASGLWMYYRRRD